MINSTANFREALILVPVRAAKSLWNNQLGQKRKSQFCASMLKSARRYSRILVEDYFFQRMRFSLKWFCQHSKPENLGVQNDQLKVSEHFCIAQV